MKNFISLFLVVSILSLSMPLTAKERKGADLIIQRTDGTQVRGELIAVKQTSLLLLERDSGADVRDIYGGGMMFGGEVSIGVWRGLDVWFGGSYFSKKGELTFTKEETKLEIYPLGGGLKYRLTTGVIKSQIP